jgi:hypothetical protein
MPLGTAYRNRATAAGPGTGPYTVGLGVSVSETGLVGEPSGSGYARQAATINTTGNTHTITNTVTFGTFSGSLGSVRAWGVFNNAGEFIFGGPLAARSTLNGPAVTFNANSLVCVLL